MHTKIERALEHISFLSQHFKRSETKYIVLIVMLDMDFPTKYDGFEYLEKSICLYSDDPGDVIVNGLYRSVAKLYGGKVAEQQIEQSIRSVINAAWKRRDPAIWGKYFDEEELQAKPSNAELITRLARLVELWKGWCEISQGSKEGAV